MSGPESDEARTTVDAAPGFRGQGTSDRHDCAQPDALRKRIATLTARAALAGLLLKPLPDGAWQVLNQFGQPATVQSLQAAEAPMYGCELVRADVSALMGRVKSDAGTARRAKP